VSALAVREQYCPDFSDTTVYDVVNIPQDCQDLWNPYCSPNPDDPILPSPSNVPFSCQPTYYASASDDQPGQTSPATSGGTTSVVVSSRSEGGAMRISGPAQATISQTALTRTILDTRSSKATTSQIITTATTKK
jgi:hypothetical protein